MRRTITVPTLDAGDVTLTEPSWCTGISHQHAVHRTDICHYGPDVTITVGTESGPRPLLTLFLAQHPFAAPKPTWSPGTRVYVAVHLLDGDHYSYDVAGLDQLANDMYEVARRVRLVANRLAIENPIGGGR
jgi:hypothetical protein